MANSLGNGLLNKAFWSKVMQEVRYKELVAMKIANVELRALLKNGDVVHKPYRSTVRGQAYTKGTAFTVQDISATDDTLTVNVIRVAPFYLDDVDSIQNSYQTAKEFASDSMDKLNRFVDGDVLAEYANATSDIDDGDVGGTDGNTIVLSTSNINKVFTAAARKLDLLNVRQSERFAVISPSVLEIIRQYLAGKDTEFGEKVGMNGFVGRRFGFDLFLSNNLAYTATWTPADNPSESDTVTIAGVVFTFNADPSGAGSVDIGGTTAVSIDNLVAAINDAGTAGTTYIQLTDASRATLEGCVAADGTTNMTIVFQGGSEVALASLQASEWSAETLHLLMGKKGATNLVMQKAPSVTIKEVPDKLGKNYAPWMLYGLKTFNNDKDLLVDVKIDGSVL
jgi:hypothetical protein